MLTLGAVPLAVPLPEPTSAVGCTPGEAFCSASPDPSPTHFPLRVRTAGGRSGAADGEGGDMDHLSRLNVNSRPLPAAPVPEIASVAASAITCTASWKVVIPAWRAAGPATGFPLTSTRMSPIRRTSRAAASPTALEEPNATSATAAAVAAVAAVAVAAAAVTVVAAGSQVAAPSKAAEKEGSSVEDSSSRRYVGLLASISASTPSAVVNAWLRWRTSAVRTTGLWVALVGVALRLPAGRRSLSPGSCGKL